MVMLRLRRPLRSASTLLLFGSARSFSLLGPLSSRLRPPFNLRVRCQASLPDSEEGWRTLLTPSQFSVLRNAATEPSGYSENKEGELEYKLKTELKTKYPADGAYWCLAARLNPATLLRCYSRARTPCTRWQLRWLCHAAVLREVEVQQRVRLARFLRRRAWRH